MASSWPKRAKQNFLRLFGMEESNRNRSSGGELVKSGSNISSFLWYENGALSHCVRILYFISLLHFWAPIRFSYTVLSISKETSSLIYFKLKFIELKIKKRRQTFFIPLRKSSMHRYYGGAVRLILLLVQNVLVMFDWAFYFFCFVNLFANI